MTRAAPGRDAGESLVELLVTVVILGIATAGISGALLTAVTASDVHERQSLARNALRSWAEQLGAGTYTACATAAGFGAPDPGLPRGLTGAVSGVQYWNGTAFTGSCGTDTGIQRVTLRITATDGRSPPLTEVLAVVLRRPCESAC